MTIAKKTVYEYKGKTFNTEQEASDYAVREMLIGTLNHKLITPKFCHDWGEVLQELEEEGYTITKKGEIK